MVPSSSSDLNNNKNTTTNELPPEWQTLDLSELHKRHINFNKGHLISLWSFLNSHTCLDFQDSIDGFVYDIDHGHIIARRGYLNFLIGIIRNGGLYCSAHYVSPERKIILAQIKIAEDRKKEQTDYEKIQEDEKFQKWFNENQEKIYKLVDKQSTALGIDFKCNGIESRIWVKDHLYGKI